MDDTEWLTITELSRRLDQNGYRIGRHWLACLVKMDGGLPFRFGRKRYNKLTLLTPWPDALVWFINHRQEVQTDRRRRGQNRTPVPIPPLKPAPRPMPV